MYKFSVNLSERPSLIITTEKRVVVHQNFGKTIPLFETDVAIRDTAIRLIDSLLYVCDESDRLHLIAFDKKNAMPESTLVLNPNNTDFRPWSLTIDWLNSRLYVAGSNDKKDYWEIGVTDLRNSENVTELLTGLMSQPKLMEVDPCNGYLFWMTSEGIYRIDLGDIDKIPEPEVSRKLYYVCEITISLKIKIITIIEKFKPQLILRKQHLGSFMVDYANKRLLVAYQFENTVKSVSMDGKIVIDVRINVKQPKLKNVTTMSIADGLLYWSDGVDVLAENYDSNNLVFFHNVLLSNRYITF